MVLDATTGQNGVVQARVFTEAVEVTLARLHESDAAMAAVAEELGQLSSTARSAHGEAERLRQSIRVAEQARDRDVDGLAGLEQRLELASQTTDEAEPDPAERDRLAQAGATLPTPLAALLA